MRQSQYVFHTLREAPRDEVAVNAQLLIRAGFVSKLQAGVYTLLPFGLRALEKIERVVREEMNAIGGQELFMPALHPKEIWEATGRWGSFDALLRLKSKAEAEYALGATHEEVIYPLLTHYIASYKDLPVSVYQIQTKFRDEPRAKSGLLRGREFRMKDMY
ncbi:MAG: aminoacyl--tRNA ligase-related protein, partial [bacterium]|nr:aminoacyl--tRNA ligase-related protein [bacterium]